MRLTDNKKKKNQSLSSITPDDVRASLGIKNGEPLPLYEGQKLMSRLTGYTESWYEKQRHEGGGPPYIKCGRLVKYPIMRTLAWFEEFERANTSEQ